MSSNSHNPWLHRFAVLTALATLGLVGIGGLVTSHGVGMAVPDWPTSYGYNMFALPLSTWLTGGVFHEHTHRLWASVVGVLVVVLTRWLGGRKACLPLIIVGVAELILGQVLLRFGPEWKGGGHFLSGIGGVVLLAGIVWVKNAPSIAPLPKLGWIAFVLVQLQGLLGGLRVVLDAQMVGDVRMGTAFGVFHGCLAQVFLVLLAAIALMTSGWWVRRQGAALDGNALPLTPSLSPKGARGSAARSEERSSGRTTVTGDDTRSPAHTWFLVTTVLILAQLLIAATMRHQHAGLAIPDFPLAYGELWPDTSAEAVARYNSQRVETTAANHITAFQINLQMVHRVMAVLILAGVIGCAWQARKNASAPTEPALRCIANVWLALISVQVALGAWTIWSNKAADVATLHVVVGSLSLVTGALGCLISFRRFVGVTETRGAPESQAAATSSSIAFNP